MPENNVIVDSPGGVTLAGGASVTRRVLQRALSVAPRLVAADGGADRLLALGQMPEAVIGDMDSLSVTARARLDEAALHRIGEQESTDFDKCLRSIAAPFIVAVGFSGGRVDHALAAYSSLLRHPAQRVVLLGGEDLCFLAPEEMTLRLPPRTRLSLYPMAPVSGQSHGLRWPIDGLELAPGGRIGTSNETEGEEVSLSFQNRAMLVILPSAHLRAVLSALVPAA